MPLPYARQARLYLGRQDSRLRPIMARVGPYRPRLNSDRFAELLRSIISQQVSTKAAAAIFRRLEEAVGPRRLTPARLLKTPLATLRSAGLSAAKAAYALDLAERVQSGELRLARLHLMPDAEVIAELTQVHGIGVWTAEMFLIFSLGRPDVLPVGDLGLRTAVQRLDSLPALPTPAMVRARGAAWSPFRSVATWYLWQSLRF
jgi:DNA-3-methyladenine glycosylase II